MEGITTTVQKVGPNGDVEREVELPPGPVGASNPPIDPEKVRKHLLEHERFEEKARAAEQVSEALGIDPEEEAHVRLFIKRMEAIREERQALNQQKADAKADLQEHAPGVDFTALMIAYNIYVAAETEQEAGASMKHTAETINRLSTIWAQPTLFDA